MVAVELLAHEMSISNYLFYFLVTITSCLFAYYYWEKSRQIAKIGNLLPGPDTLPVLGNIHLLMNVKSPQEAMSKLIDVTAPYKCYGIGRGWLGPKLLVFLGKPEDIEMILSSHEHIEKSSEYRLFRPWFGNGLLISTGDTWRNHRKLIAPAFHLNVLKSFLAQLNANSRVLVERLRKEALSGGEFDVHDYVAEITVDTLLETVMGVKRQEQQCSTFSYAMAVMRLCNIIHQRTYKIWFQIKKLNDLWGYGKEEAHLLNIVHDLSEKVFTSKKRDYLQKLSDGPEKIAMEHEAADMETKDTYFDNTKGLTDDLDEDIGEKKRLPFLEHLIDTNQNGGPISEKEIRNQLDTIMFEGHDTVAAGSSFLLCILGYRQDVQDKVMEEMYEIFGDSDRPATFNDTLQMKYLERVILETLRLFPPVPIIARKINKDVKTASGYTIPAGATCIIPQFYLHRLPEVYPDPLTFDPDNFLPERTSKRHYYSFIPFSAGPRSCVGRKYAMLKLKVMISTLVRNYKVLADMPYDQFPLQADIILKRSDGFMIRVEERRKATAT
ncbi:cytochrome P450 4g15-like [Bacillus rossius redtenbacheri]|uniref:cytochrome P450 4g15-like n=1 Tax=Bacillus rossius redtenbacheri TaxID=93214 RepID=UPI002FDEA3D0